MSEQSFRPETIPVTDVTCREFRDLVKQITDELPLDMDGESRSDKLGDKFVTQAPSIVYKGGTDYEVWESVEDSPLEGVVYEVDTIFKVSEDVDGVLHAEREVQHDDVSPRTIVPRTEEEQRRYDELKAKMARITPEEFEQEFRRRMDAMDYETRNRLVDQIHQRDKDKEEERQLGLKDISEQELQRVIRELRVAAESESVQAETVSSVPEFPFTEPLLVHPSGHGYQEDDYTKLVDTHTGFDRIFDAERRQKLQEAILQATKSLGLEPADVLLAGFEGDSLSEAVDTEKMESLNVGSGLSTDDLMAQTRGSVDSIDDEIKAAAHRMMELDDEGMLDEATRQEHLQRIESLKQQRSDQAPGAELDMEHGWPVYYFSTTDAVLDPNSEDNPLAYSLDNEGNGKVGIYARYFLEQNSHRYGHLTELSPRADDQIVVAAKGETVQQALVGVLTFKVVLPTKS